MSEAGGGELFIVDNSVSGWTGLEYLSQWTDVARSFDIATGFFEIGALLALDGKWQQLERIRLLMGDEVSLRTHNVFKEALRQRVGRLDDSREHEASGCSEGGLRGCVILPFVTSQIDGAVRRGRAPPLVP